MTLSQKGVRYDSRNEITDPAVKRALDDIVSQIQAVALQTNATPAGSTPPPTEISSLSVTSANGIFDAQIFDNNPVKRGIEYFLEYSVNPNGPWTVISLGPGRNFRSYLGNQTFYWRAYSQYPTSQPSPVVYFGSVTTPTAVVGGGASAGPTPQASTGSGTAPSNGLSGGQGYGSQPFRP